MKRCSKCDTEKALGEFHRNRSRPDGLAYWCKACYADLQRRQHADPVVKAKHRRRVRAGHLRRRYGITLDEYEKLLIEQAGRCGLCFKPITSERWLVVDHDHATGRVRGLLCSPCNRLLHSLDGEGGWLDRAIRWTQQ